MALVFGGEVQPCLHILHQAHVLLQHLPGKEECFSSLLQVPPASFSHPSHKTFQGCWSHTLDPFHPRATSDQGKMAQDPRCSKALLTKLRVLSYLTPVDGLTIASQIKHKKSLCSKHRWQYTVGRELLDNSRPTVPLAVRPRTQPS